jgi:hypothetical protein
VSTEPTADSPAAPAHQPLHPRYQRDWERDRSDWPKDWDIEPHKHDLSDHRFLTPEHRAAVDSGELDLPDRTQSEHTAVLVSIPDDMEGTEVAWVDRGVAEVVQHCARLGVPTVESCEAADPGYGWKGGPTLWFNDHRAFKRFQQLVAPVSSPDWYVNPNHGRLERALQFLGRSWQVEIPVEDMPKLTAYLRDKEN